MKKLLNVLLTLALLTGVCLPALKVHAAGANLVLNPSVETESNSKPVNWTTNSWGTNAPTFSYDTLGHTGNRSLSVTLANRTSGDAKWMSDQMQVISGKTYTSSDFSKASVATELDLAYVNTTGQMNFVYLATVPASTTWQQTTAEFTVPANMASVSVYHLIYSNGSLQTDDFSLTQKDAVTEPTPPVVDPTPTPPVTPPTSSTNLIANPSFETANGADPTSWNRGGWGDNSATLTYLANDAHTGTRSVNVSLTRVVSGDAKWYSNAAPVTAGSSYTYQDYYKSNVATRIVVVMTNASGAVTYQELANAPLSTSWLLYSGNFTVPTGITSVSIYHLLDKVGSLTIDDTSLTLSSTTTPPTTDPTPPTQPSNPIANPSFETANGTVPANWSSDKWGTNTATFSYVNGGAHTGTKSSKVTVSNYVSGDAKWSFTPIMTLTPGSQYSFSAWYKTNTQPRVVATYVDATNTNQYLTLPLPNPGSSAATTWQQYSATLDIPQNAKSMTVFFLISSNGWLQTDDFNLTPYQPVGFNAPLITLTFDDGTSSLYDNGLPILKKYGLVSTQYLISGTMNTSGNMTTAMAQQFMVAGSEIGSHSVTHPDLTKLTSTQLNTELKNSQTTLRQLLGGTSVADSFASPYGLYNSTTLAAIKQTYKSHRSTDVGFNTKDNFNPYNILVQDINADTTPSQVAAWVAKAQNEKSWLVLVYHNINTTASSDYYATTTANLDAELSNIQASGIAVKTISQALAILQAQL